MYNILLTDDEQIVIDSLSFIIEKNFPEQFNIFKANSGADAVYTCKSNKIDIIFMDINMPGLTGLEAIAEIKKFNADTVVIILSAFDRFGYAQEALALGAYRYLTKPVNRNLVIQTVRNAMSLIDSVEGKITNDIEIKEKLSFVSSIVENDFIYSSIFSDVNEDYSDLSKYLEYFKMDVSGYFFCVVEVPEAHGENRYNEYLKIRDVIIACTECIIGPFMNNRVVVFIPFEPSNDEEMDKIRQQDLVRSIFSRLAMQISAKTRIGVGNIQTDIKQTVKSYNSALKALNNIDEEKSGKPDVLGGGISFAMADKKKVNEKDFDSSRYEQVVLSRVGAGDITGATSQMQVLLSAMFENNMELNSIRNNCFRILVNARSLANEKKKGYSSNSAFDETFSILINCISKSEFENYMLPQIGECTSILSEYSISKDNPVIIKAKEFIEKHLDENISLEQTSEIVKVNPFYLSKLFKEETGSNFIDFVTDKRLERARNLLRKDELSIKEVSHCCGYSDQNYFSKLFRKKFGITPTEFRNGV